MYSYSLSAQNSEMEMQSFCLYLLGYQSALGLHALLKGRFPVNVRL